MTEKEKIKRDIELSFEFLRYLIDHPEEIEKIPDGAEIYIHEKSRVQRVRRSRKQKQVHVIVKRDFEIKRSAA